MLLSLEGLEEVQNQSASLNQAGQTLPKQERRLSSSEIEQRLCSVKKPKGQMRKRGLHVWDLLEGQKIKTNNHGGKGCQVTNVTSFPFVLGLAMRKNGDGAKSVGKKLNLPWQQFQNIVRDLGLKPLTMRESRNTNALSLVDKAQRLYEEAAMADIRQGRKGLTWSSHIEIYKHQQNKRWRNDPGFKARKTEQVQRWRDRNPKRHKEICKAWHDNNKEYKREYDKKWRADNPEKLKAIRNNPINKVRRNIRGRLKEHLNGTWNQTSNVGCSTNELRKYLELQFKPNMNWKNYGKVWHIDHIRPLSSFDLMDEDQCRAVNHYTNLQPMYAKDNLAKSDKWDGQQEFIHELL